MQIYILIAQNLSIFIMHYIILQLKICQRCICLLSEFSQNEKHRVEKASKE